MTEEDKRPVGKLTKLKIRRNNNPGSLTVKDLSQFSAKDGVHVDGDEFTKKRAGIHGGPVTPLVRRSGRSRGRKVGG